MKGRYIGREEGREGGRKRGGRGEGILMKPRRGGTVEEGGPRQGCLDEAE